MIAAIDIADAAWARVAGLEPLTERAIGATLAHLGADRNVEISVLFAGDEEAASDPSRRFIRVASVIPTGRIDAHDVAYDLDGPLFVNTRFNCIARPGKRAGFKPIWLPAFMRDESPMQQVDCCHLNGLGLHDGLFLGMATAFCDRATPAA